MRIKVLNFFISTIVILFFFGCTHRPMDGSMMEWGPMTGYGGMLLWLILIIIAGVIVCVVFERSKKTGNQEQLSGESSMEILKRRYASGEISKEEFERIRRDIEG